MPELDVWLEKHDVVFRNADGNTYRCDVEKVEVRTALRILMVLARKSPQDAELQQLIETMRKHPQVRDGHDPAKPRLIGERPAAAALPPN